MLRKQEKSNSPDYMKTAKENIRKQAGMAGLAIVMTIILIFAMTVAWYSNVIHTDELVFETATWDFDFEGSVEIANEKQIVAPGDSGIVKLQLSNNSDDAITVLVNATKDGSMPDIMKNRIYFYVDNSQLINGEVVERIYINETDEYAYTVLGQNTLTLNEEYHNDAHLKWEWVYDVLGYYVSGKMGDNGRIIVDDYMRPVVYDYDKAMYDEEGELVSVDSGVSKADFLQTLFETDGYKGKTVPSPTVGGYYPVAVDEDSNYGIWLYLLNEKSIEYETSIDNQLSKGDGSGNRYSFSGRLMLSGQQKREAEVHVATAEDLRTQLNAAGIDKVTLGGNLTLSETIQLANGQKVVLDLNGKTLTVPAGKTGIDALEGSSLTVINGNVDGSGKGVAFHSVGAEVTLSKVKITNVERAVYIEDNKGVGLDSRSKITGCDIDVNEVGVLVRGNGSVSARKTAILIENSTIKSGELAIMGNGSDAQSGTDIEVIGSTITGAVTGIYQPQKNSYIKITDSTVTGVVAIAIKGGSVEIKDTVVQGTGPKQTPKFEGSGFTDTGDAIYVETGYGTEITVDISGNKTMVKSEHSYAIQVFEPNSEYATVTVRGGKYSSDISNFVPDGYDYKVSADGCYEVGEAAASSAN